jgi:predicted HicB family RNase H-like nuclease
MPAVEPSGDLSEAFLRRIERAPKLLKARVPESVYQAVADEAEKRGMSSSAFVGAAVRVFLHRLGHRM